MGNSAGTQAKQEDSRASACPVPEEYRNPAVYNVYNQRINGPDAGCPANAASKELATDILNPTNNMPLEANQQPCPGQRKLLSTDRQESNIPKGGTDSTWLYPSAQMFYNALKRKGKGDDVTEDDMAAVVLAHNSMNEATWDKVMAWERLHACDCSHPTLLRFRGRPDDLSPLARLRSWFGGPLPFDRHDWYVDRCGREVRYVIDFYYDESKSGTHEAFEVVARPAVDTLDATMDRLKMVVYGACARAGLPCPVTGHAPQPPSADNTADSPTTAVS